MGRQKSPSSPRPQYTVVLILDGLYHNTLHVYDLTVVSWGAEDGDGFKSGCQATDCSSRLRFNTDSTHTVWQQNLDNLQSCLQLVTKPGDLLNLPPCLRRPKQDFKAKIYFPNQVGFVPIPNQTISTELWQVKIEAEFKETFFTSLTFAKMDIADIHWWLVWLVWLV